MNKQTTYAIVAVLVIVIIIAGAAAYLLYGNGGGTTNPTATPTPSPTTTVGDATTLTFSSSVTSSGSTIVYNWAGKDIHGAPVIRVDFAGYSYLLDAGKEKSWSSTDNGVTWTAGNFADDWPSWSAQWFEYVDYLTPGHWSGSGNYSYTDTLGQAVVLSNIVINPTIPDSTFAEPT